MDDDKGMFVLNDTSDTERNFAVLMMVLLCL